jgi:hypothetical protein
MISREADETSRRGEVLVHLRHGIRESTRLAEQLVGDAIVGSEAQGLLGRLRAIRAELDVLALQTPNARRAINDPFWNVPPYTSQQVRPNQAGM